MSMYERIFFLGMRWGLFEQFTSQVALLVHQFLLYKVCGVAYGPISVYFSYVWLVSSLLNFGLDLSLSFRFAGALLSRGAFLVWVLWPVLFQVPLLLCGSAVVFWWLGVPGQLYWLLVLCSALEGFRRSLRIILQFSGRFAYVSLVEFLHTSLYLLLAWSVFFGGVSFSPFVLLVPLAVVGAVSVGLLLPQVLSLYWSLPTSHEHNSTDDKSTGSKPTDLDSANLETAKSPFSHVSPSLLAPEMPVGSSSSSSTASTDSSSTNSSAGSLLTTNPPMTSGSLANEPAPHNSPSNTTPSIHAEAAADGVSSFDSASLDVPHHPSQDAVFSAVSDSTTPPSSLSSSAPASAGPVSTSRDSTSSNPLSHPSSSGFVPTAHAPSPSLLAGLFSGRLVPAVGSVSSSFFSSSFLVPLSAVVAPGSLPTAALAGYLSYFLSSFCKRSFGVAAAAAFARARLAPAATKLPLFSLATSLLFVTLFVLVLGVAVCPLGFVSLLVVLSLSEQLLLTYERFFVTENNFLTFTLCNLSGMVLVAYALTWWHKVPCVESAMLVVAARVVTLGAVAWVGYRTWGIKPAHSLFWVSNVYQKIKDRVRSVIP